MPVDAPRRIHSTGCGRPTPELTCDSVRGFATASATAQQTTSLCNTSDGERVARPRNRWSDGGASGVALVEAGLRWRQDGLEDRPRLQLVLDVDLLAGSASPAASPGVAPRPAIGQESRLVSRTTMKVVGESVQPQESSDIWHACAGARGHVPTTVRILSSVPVASRPASEPDAPRRSSVNQRRR